MPRQVVVFTAQAWGRDKAEGQIQVQVPAWPLPSCGTLGKSFDICEIQCLGMRIIHHRALVIKRKWTKRVAWHSAGCRVSAHYVILVVALVVIVALLDSVEASTLTPLSP